MKRRKFIASVAATSVLSKLAVAEEPKLRVGVIGHTGRGNYGHGLDTVWKSLPSSCDITAVADANKAGLNKAKKKLSVPGYSDYREMLSREKPDIVAVCPRHPDQHRDMMIAAIESGVRGIYVEKPFVRTPTEADQVISACQQHGTKVAVAHRNRYHPVLKTIDQLIADKVIGKVLEIRGRGKGDRRGGGEDLWVLGSHILNLFNYFGGAPKSCSSVMLQNDRYVKAADVKPGNEGLGPLAANELHARYEMERGMVAYFDSIANDGTKNKGFGLQIIGSAGRICIQADANPLAFLQRGNPLDPRATPKPWEPISSAGPGKPEPNPTRIKHVSHHVAAAEDLVNCIRTNGEPLCNARDGRTTVEMICGVFASHREGGKAVSFPLAERGNALTGL